MKNIGKNLIRCEKIAIFFIAGVKLEHFPTLRS